MSLIVNIGGMGVAAMGYLNPFMAAILHNLSTIGVVINSAQLIKYEPDNPSMLPSNSETISSQPLLKS